MVFTSIFLCIHWNDSLAYDGNLNIEEIYKGHSFLAGAGNILGATAWRSTSGAWFNQDLSFTGKEHFGNRNDYTIEYPVYYKNSHCIMYGLGEFSFSVPTVKAGSVYGISSMKRIHKKVELYLIGGYAVRPHYLWIDCKADVLAHETSIAVLESLLPEFETDFTH